MYELRKSSNTLTRPNNTTAYGAFQQISDVSGNILALPVPINRPFFLHRVSLVFDWAVSSNPLNVRVRLIDTNPSPPLVLVDGNDGGSYPLATYYDNVSVTGDVSVFPSNGLSFGAVNVTTANLALRSNSGSLNCFLFQTNGTNTVANGKVLVNIYYRITN